jgi:putative ABC transport system permease protein
VIILENVRAAFTSLRANKLRAALTMLGIGIGVAAVIVLVSLGQAVQNYVAAQFLGIGSNLAFIFPAGFVPGQNPGGGLPGAGRSALAFSTLTERDVDALSDPFNVPAARAVVPQVTLRRTTEYEAEQVRARIVATTPEYFTVRNRALAAGRAFDDEDVIRRSRVAVLGQTTVEAIFPSGVNPVGTAIRIDGITFQVVGVVERYGGGSFQDEDDFVAIPITTAQTRLENVRNRGGQRAMSVIFLQAVDEREVVALVDQARETLRRLHGIAFREEDDFEIFTQDDILESVGQISSLLTVFLAIIAGISLLVGGIGIMNIMLVTVTERTREIGLRKAVGARGSDVLTQFLVEATTLALIGGGGGLTVALLGTLGLGALLPQLEAQVRGESVLLATGISAAIGIFFGLYPASRASRLNPIDALRYE